MKWKKCQIYEVTIRKLVGRNEKKNRNEIYIWWRTNALSEGSHIVNITEDNAKRVPSGISKHL